MSLAAWFWWRPPCLGRRVVVNVDGDEAAYEGVLWASRGEWFTLRDVQQLPPDKPPLLVDGQPIGDRPSSPISVTGEIVIHRARVLFLQVLP